MSVSLGNVLRESTDRITTAAGAAAFGLLLLLSFLNTFFAHNQGTGQEQEELRQAEEELRADDPQAAESLEWLFDFADLLFESQTVFDVGLSSGIAWALGILILVPFAIGVLVSVRAIGEDRDQLDSSLLEGIGWRSANFIGGLIGLIALLVVFAFVAAILSVIPLIGIIIALVVFVLSLVSPFVLGFVLFYWTPAIAIGNDNAVEALKTSVSIARNNVGSTLAMVVLYIVLSIVNFGIFVAVLYTAGPTVAAILNVALSTGLWLLVVAWMGTGYDLADTESEEPQPPGQQEWERNRNATPAGSEWNEGRSGSTDGEWGSTQGEQSSGGPGWSDSGADQRDSGAPDEGSIGGAGSEDGSTDDGDSDDGSAGGWSVDDDESRE